MESVEVEDLIRYLFPAGTRGTPGEIHFTPIWPPDLFGVAAYIAQVTDCYTGLLDFHTLDSIGRVIQADHARLLEVGGYLAHFPDWRSLPTEIGIVIDKLWFNLLAGDNHSDEKSGDAWKTIVLKILIIADTACEGLGFYNTSVALKANPLDENDIPCWIGQVYAWMTDPQVYARSRYFLSSGTGDWFWDFQAFVSTSPGATSFEKQYSPSACILIPPQRLCVLPKCLTPRVGCTIRSLSQNLSLHPGRNQVEANWINHRFDSQFDDKYLNILIVPYPYNMRSTSFQPSSHPTSKVHTFSVSPTWLAEEPPIDKLITQLYAAAIAEGKTVDVVILPELALDHPAFLRLASTMAELSPDFMMLIAGVSVQSETGVHVNTSYTAYIENGLVHGYSIQNKHHRWKLDDAQIKTYGLRHQLDPTFVWWEDTDVSGRTVDYHVFQKGACFSSLICEDLARQDPCKPSIQAVGPNLIFALLMDAPQLKNRWPGRYTTGLVEDPGTSLLTVSSLGLIERSNWVHNATRRTVALWGDQNSIREIDLPLGYEAILLVLANSEKPLYTLDNRTWKGQFWNLETLLPLKGL